MPAIALLVATVGSEPRVAGQAWMMDAFVQLTREFRCEHFYIDIGTNRGVQLRKLHEPASYPNATVQPLYRRLFGPNPECARVCTIGFEPNPHHHRWLAQIESRYRSLGAGVLIVPAAAGDAEGVLPFGVSSSNATDDNGDWSASAFPVWRGSSHWDKVFKRKDGTHIFGLYGSLTVPMVDVAPLFKAASKAMEAIHREGVRPKLLVKMDCEGGEYKLLPHLLLAQALCLADHVYIEWHEKFYSRAVALLNAKKEGLRAGRQGADAHQAMMRAVHNAAVSAVKTAGCGTRIEALADDGGQLETPWNLPLPTRPLCAAAQ
jgi:FkbM family methyltransferase